ncbi:MAG: carbamoyl phosphate synthase large subunit, partial [Verrucomicrobiota bacterium]
RGYADAGFTLYATSGTRSTLEAANIPVEPIFKINEGRPNILDMLTNEELQLIINTPSGKAPREDEMKIRSAGAGARIPIMTTLSAARASLTAIQSLQKADTEVMPLQDYHP